MAFTERANSGFVVIGSVCLNNTFKKGIIKAKEKTENIEKKIFAIKIRTILILYCKAYLRILRYCFKM